MSDFNWCHGPECHQKHTVDRVRGVKGSKVIRTRKVPTNNWNRDNYWRYFCSQGCMHDFVQKNIDEFVRIAPRPDALETPIKDPKRECYHTTSYGYNYYETKIEVDESRQID